MTVPVGPNAGPVICPYCHAATVTRVVHNPTSKTHLMAILLCCLCFCFTCVPYCVDSCQNTDHYCPNCQAYIGTYKA